MEEICSHEINKKIIDVYFLIYLFFKSQLNNMCQKLIISQIYVCVCARGLVRTCVSACMIKGKKQREKERKYAYACANI